jgi:DNA uptake protein ComE-like DNA-binding protein
MAQSGYVLINRKPSGNIVNPRIDLNAAAKAEMMQLPGIDEALAEAIIGGRPYKAVDELLSRKILSAEAYEVIQDEVHGSEEMRPT